MKVVGRVESLWRYPVKSMRGEQMPEVFVGFPGVYGDRLYAFRSSAAPKGFPYLTGREQEAMLLYRATYRQPERMIRPANLAEAEASIRECFRRGRVRRSDTADWREDNDRGS